MQKEKKQNSVLCVPWLGDYVLEYEVHLFLKYRLRLPQRDKGFINWYLKQNQLFSELVIRNHSHYQQNNRKYMHGQQQQYHLIKKY